MSVDIVGSVVLITGASGGLGTGLSLELARHGARLALVARRQEPLDTLADRVRGMGANAVAVPGDVTRKADRRRVIEETERQLGPIDILVNIAGIGRAGPFVDEDPAPIIDLNLLAPIALAREVVGGMVKRGRGQIVSVSSIAALGLPYIVDYSASKAGLIAFSTGLREELRGTGVSTTVLLPGFIVDSGIYVAYQTPVPWYVGSNRTATISRKAVAAIRSDRPVAVLNQLPARPLLALKVLSENGFRSIVNTLGLNRYMSAVAAEQLAYDGSRPGTLEER